ncbi:MAG: hypothetical protein WC877_01380 [Dehalococcoidales bacterium]
MKYLYFKDVVKIIKTVQSDVKLNITPDGMWVRAVDTSNVMMINLNLPKSLFEHYNMENQVIYLDMNKITNFANMTYGWIEIKQVARNGELVYSTLNLSSGKFTMMTSGIDGNLVKKEPKVPDNSILNDATVIVKAFDVRNFLRSIKSSCNKVKIYVSENNSSLKALDESLEQDVYQLQVTSGCVDSNHETSLYSIGYLYDAFKYIKNDVAISMSTDTPCKISFNFNDIPVGCYYLAPRVEAD